MPLIFPEVLQAIVLHSSKHSCPLSFTVFAPSSNQSAYCPLPWADLEKTSREKPLGGFTTLRHFTQVFLSFFVNIYGSKSDEIELI